MMKNLLALIHWRDAVSALPDFALGIVYLLTWIFPSMFSTGFLSTLFLTLCLECITILFAYPIELEHISDDSPEKKQKTIRNLVLVFLTCCSVLSVVFQVPWPMVAGTMVMLNRLMAVLLGNIPTGKEKASVRIRAVVSVLLILWSFTIVQAISSFPGIGLPSFGITNTIRAQERLFLMDPVEVLAFGFCYYSSLGVFELCFQFIMQRLSPNIISDVKP
ncbi:MAG: hypothetical protein V1799_10010 [bacterium]